MTIYERLGLRRVINAHGTVTILGGSMMPREVVEAMDEAAKWFVDLPELHRVAGRHIAELIDSPAIEDAAVVCGAAAGLAVATAACVAGTDRAKIRALPHLDWDGARDQVVIQRSHVTGFAQNYCNAGPRLVEVGGTEGATPEEIESAISERTAAVTFLGGELEGNARFPTRTSLAELVALAHARGVPVIVDAAAELPPAEHLRLFSELGADLVIFSGGKGLRGPQASGLILGKHGLVEACRLNNNPHASVGRPMKVGKEEICGLLRAVELYVARDHAADIRQWEAWAQAVLDGVRELDGISGEQFLARGIPQVRLTVDERRAGLSAAALTTRLRDGDPSIWMTHAGDTLTVNPHNLQPGEAEHIVERMSDLLG
ncbi:MAG: L-seryl-tRNA(Sec) selenium transferase-related protein [uncultured Chloroflexi bacterium]|uniref:L-seryl-tRNA(Sec) selenium transferase-related protein n=1 Tax=uncultured Chloroflexota bacterium TaxID=166587 RepID=A0A6J4J1D3_9CHLR|nr:MAG: L-seryl-tRNA(Sec) selenium transferase-related protein [uncultured Chloroflexota bacterium]